MFNVVLICFLVMVFKMFDVDFRLFLSVAEIILSVFFKIFNDCVSSNKIGLYDKPKSTPILKPEEFFFLQ